MSEFWETHSAVEVCVWEVSWGDHPPVWGQHLEGGRRKKQDAGSADPPESSRAGHHCRAGPSHVQRAQSFYTVSPLHTNLEAVSFQRCEPASHQWQAWVKLQPALRLLLLTILRLHHLPPPLFLQSGTPLAWTLDASPCMSALIPYCKVKNVLFIFCVYYVLFAQSWTWLQQLSTAQTFLGLYCNFCLNFSVLILSLDVCYRNWWLSFLLSPVSVSLALFFNTYFPWCLPDMVMF